MTVDISLEKYLIENFKWFHRHPELPYEEYETTTRIKEILTEQGITILPYPLQTGLVAIVEGRKKSEQMAKPVTALRIDIDALPIVENSKVDYRSEKEGLMHACGHDLHIIAGIGAAILLKRQENYFCGTVKFIFQPAEEESHGALKILETDVMDDVPKIWGFHADPTNAVGVIGIREGYVTAAVDRFQITVEGVGCHGAHPDDGVDPIPAATAIVQGLYSIVSRNVNAFRPSLLSVTRIESGKTWNVIPPKAELEGTVRTLYKEDRLLYEKRVREVAMQTASAYGAKAEVLWEPGPPATYNDGGMAQTCEGIAHACGMKTVPEEKSMGGDDFAFFQDSDTMKREVPGCYVKIGVGEGYPIHHPSFTVDTTVIGKAAVYLAKVLMSDMI